MHIKTFTETGSYHTARKEKNQDYLCSAETDCYAVIVLADGATGCRKGREGAMLACRSVLPVIEWEGDRFFQYPEQKLTYLLKEQILYAIEQELSEGESLQDYGSTFLMAFLNKQSGETVLINLGDGAVYLREDGKLTMVLGPKQYRGNPCLTTTNGAEKAFEVKRLTPEKGNDIILCTDGCFSLLSKDAELEKLLEEQAYLKLNRALHAAEHPDDCSYIAMTI